MISSDVLFIAGLLVFLFCIGIVVVLLTNILRDTPKITEVNNRSYKLEHMVQTLMNNIQLNHVENTFNEMLKDQAASQGVKTIYRSNDGKYQADSMDKLLFMMANDPNSGINPNDMDALRRIFEQISKEVDDSDEDEDESKDKA